MAVTDYSATAASNTAISGINIAEGCPAANTNNAIRQLMADVRVMYNGLPDTSTLVTKTGGVFTGNPTFTGRGGYMHNFGGTDTGGAWYTIAFNATAPSGMAVGDWLVELEA